MHTVAFLAHKMLHKLYAVSDAKVLLKVGQSVILPFFNHANMVTVRASVALCECNAGCLVISVKSILCCRLESCDDE